MNRMHGILSALRRWRSASGHPRVRTVEGARRVWDLLDWEQVRDGELWSDVWGGSDALWARTVFPRIRPYLPVERGLEIAPGFGRLTHYLRRHCSRLDVVDLSPRCIEACRKRFADDRSITGHVNDGRSLPMIRSGSVDFAFSWDSLVHAPADALRGYVTELRRVLSSDGVAFLHHSNVAALPEDVRTAPQVTRHHRSADVSGAHSRFPGHALTPTGVMAIRCKQFHLPDL